jgi:uncharacterized phage-like protein YoqJ
MIIAVTGHRPKDIGNEYDYKGPYTTYIKNALQAIIDKYRPESMISGMAQGVDTIWALLALKNGIPLICACPCRNQEVKWPEKARKLYRTILSKASKCIYVTANYDKLCMDRRNQYMCNNCNLLIAVWNGNNHGGTYNCIEYAKSIGREIKYIDLKYFTP